MGALAGCGGESDPEDEEGADVSGLSVGEEVFVSPDIDALLATDTSPETLKEISGKTRAKALATAQDQASYTEYLTTLWDYFLGSTNPNGDKPWTASDIVDTNRIIAATILGGDVDFAQKFVTDLQITPDELALTVEKLSSELPDQIRLANGMIEKYVPSGVFVLDPSENHAVPFRVSLLFKEVDDRALTLWVIQELAVLAEGGEIEFGEDSCDFADNNSVVDTPGVVGHSPDLPASLGVVEVVDGYSGVETPGLTDLQLIGLRPIAVPLPGMRDVTAEQNCPTIQEQLMFGLGMVGAGKGRTIAEAPETEELAVMLYGPAGSPGNPSSNEVSERTENEPYPAPYPWF